MAAEIVKETPLPPEGGVRRVEVVVRHRFEPPLLTPELRAEMAEEVMRLLERHGVFRRLSSNGRKEV